MELLIVMSIMIILMLIAIPNFISMKAQADETSAIQSLRAIYQAQIQYQTNFPSNGFACSLSALGGNASSGPPSAQAAQVLQGDLATGQKSGYTFNIVNCTKVNVNNQDMYTSYEATAVPQSVGKSGHRGFCIDQAGEIKADMAGEPIAPSRFSRPIVISSPRHEKAFSAVVLFCFLCCCAQACAPSNYRPATGAARGQVLQRPAFAAVAFTESFHGMGIDREESGVLLLRKPGKMHWSYAHPPGKVFLLDGKYAWFYLPGMPRWSASPPRNWMICVRRCAFSSATPNYRRSSMG